MRLPIKLKTEQTPPGLRRFLPNKPDPARLLDSQLDQDGFSTSICGICIDGVWKTTQPARHIESNGLLRRHLERRGSSSVIDVGVSDGVTSADLFDAVTPLIRKFYATDLYLSLRAITRHGVLYLYDTRHDDCVMAVTKNLIFYNNRGHAETALGRHVPGIVARAPKPSGAGTVRLVNPRLAERATADSRIELVEWDIFTPWPGGPVDVIRAANILNPAYFPIDQLRAAARNFHAALTEHGWLYIVDNRETEKATLFEKRGTGFTPLDRLGNGCDAEPACQRMGEG